MVDHRLPKLIVDGKYGQTSIEKSTNVEAGLLKFTSSFGSSILRSNRPAKRLSAPAAQAALAAEVAEVAEVVASVVALGAVQI